MTESTTEQIAPPAEPPRNPKIGLQLPLLIVAVLAILTAGFWLRVAHIDDPVRNDEAFTYLVYVKEADYFNYSMPNNHILNTLLVSASTQMADGAPWALRLPDFLFGLALIPAVGLLCFQLCGSRLSAVVSMALAASSTALVEYSTNARGYSLIACMAAIMACVTIRLIQSPKWKTGWAVWILCGVAGLYAVPTMIYSIVPLTLLLLAGRWVEVKQRMVPLGAALLATAVIALLLYMPVFATSGVSALTANRYVTPENFQTVPGELATLARDIAGMWGGNASSLFLPFLCIGTLLCAIASAWRGSNRAMLLSVTAIAVVIAMAFIQRRVAPARVYLYLQPWIISCACAGFAVLLKRMPGWGHGLQVTLAIILILVSADNWMKVKRQPLLISEDPHTYVEAKQVVADLIRRGAGRPDASLLWNPLENIWPPLLFYYIHVRPAQESWIRWNDKSCNEVFILLSPGDKLPEFLGRHPGFSQMYRQPRLIQETPNSRIFLADRL